ncbi:secreted RxLR effector protein 161-like [Harmonia axyridis]|uniref:secreted RxLR effector protein 161-like n=1 Tax=Harmonia axyridis TaxID=115357 RepID=UPI001E279CF5|nr:secreted RxLR effector protein 161-like [Harmonia axyridis]
MAESKPVGTPTENNHPDDKSSDPLDKSIPYRSAVGSLMYLACATRPDIAYAVSKAARSMSEPTYANWTSVKRIFRYLRGTSDQGLLYTSSEDDVCAYSDADLAGDIETRRSTSGFVSLIGGTAVSWTSQLQKSVALSTTEAEFVASSEGAKELIWLKRLLSEIGA